MAQTVIANSTIAGAASYPLIMTALTAVVAMIGITIPPLEIGALVLTQEVDISIVAAILSYVVSHYTNDSIQQQIANIAKMAPKVLGMMPKTYSQPEDFPNAPKPVEVA